MLLWLLLHYFPCEAHSIVIYIMHFSHGFVTIEVLVVLCNERIEIYKGISKPVLKILTLLTSFHGRHIGAITFQAPKIRRFVQYIVQAYDMETIKAPHLWPLWEESTCDVKYNWLLSSGAIWRHISGSKLAQLPDGTNPLSELI